MAAELFEGVTTDLPAGGQSTGKKISLMHDPECVKWLPLQPPLGFQAEILPKQKAEARR
jgi:hypothetical protein